MSDSFHKNVHSQLFPSQAGGATNAHQQRRALEIARLIQSRATELQTPQEREQQQELDQLIQNPSDKATVTSITDQAFRSNSPRRSMDQLIHILDVQGIPRFFSRIDRTLLQGIRSFGGYLPGVAAPLVKEKMQRETANVILPAEDDHLIEHLDSRQTAGLRMNVNLLGEMVLGEGEASQRLKKYLHLLSLKEVEVLSVKISNLYSQITSIAMKECIPILCARLEGLLREATQHQYKQPDGCHVAKMIYLDMEEYRDMEITSQVFMETLQQTGLHSSRAGIALQAYLPDAHSVQKRLTQWALKRMQTGGYPITLRIVKGANMEMERVESSLAGFPQAPFKTKLETDANYKRMLQYGLQSKHIQAVRIGVASHNLLDLSYALVLTADAGAFDSVQFEMLEGMANHQRRALHEIASNLLLYAPACKQVDFLNAIGYLIRRLDENTGPDNFLRHAFQLETGSPQWHALEQQFLASFSVLPKLSFESRRMLKHDTISQTTTLPTTWQTFSGQPNTDFTQQTGHQVIDATLEIASSLIQNGPQQATPVINGDKIRRTKSEIYREDPSRPHVRAVQVQLADSADIAAAVTCSKTDPDHWGRTPAVERAEILRRIGNSIEAHRAELMATALLETGKTLTESDPEVSEAVDFVRFYAALADGFSALKGVHANPSGPIVVLSPWNFPIAIPCGGISAALAAGNCVILKPAPSATATALRLCECFWEGGISRKTLQCVPCIGSVAGEQLVHDPAIAAVVLTGATKTARALLNHNPKLRLFAETGGKNATIVTSLADRELAIKHVIESAFAHSGQKCSATSLLILEAEIFDDPHFKSSLVDAASSLPVGSAWSLSTRVGPLIDPPNENLKKGLATLDEGEHWALQPEIDILNPRLVSPGIKWGVRSGSYCHQTEFFGPLLSVLRADDLHHAIEIANQTPYGLTSGLESLDDREQELWSSAIQAGNLYINRPTTGAIVLRQPFGGIRNSSFGPGLKAGGPHYVNLFTRFENCRLEVENTPQGTLKPLFETVSSEAAHWNLSAEDIQQIGNTLQSYEQYCVQEYFKQHDHFRLIGQDNLRYYHPIKHIAICIESDDSVRDTILRAAAVMLTGSKPEFIFSQEAFISHQTQLCTSKLYKLIQGKSAVLSEQELIALIRTGNYGRLRFSAAGNVSRNVATAAHEFGIAIIDAPISANGMIELAWYFREQSLSIDYHRYGNLGTRSREDRSDTV